MPPVSRRTRSRSRMSPSTTLHAAVPQRPGEVLLAAPRRGCRGRRPRRRPRSTSWSTIVEPIVPAPPVTRTRAPLSGHSGVMPADRADSAIGRRRAARLLRRGLEDPQHPQAGRGRRSAAARRSRIAAANSARPSPQRLALGQRRRDHVADPVGDVACRGARSASVVSAPRGRRRGRRRASRCGGLRSSQTSVRLDAADDRRADLRRAQPVDVDVRDARRR